MDENDLPYRTQSNNGRFQVVDPSGKVIVNCGDAATAEHYMALLNQAFARGFKAGFRAAKSG
ncbi:MAG TPA: hypothetical protein VGV18_03180 [Verrucomicrobiae bacterium]|nr:hypothetical protein [Verrucomicrobiae bacterium]